MKLYPMSKMMTGLAVVLMGSFLTWSVNGCGQNSPASPPANAIQSPPSSSNSTSTFTPTVTPTSTMTATPHASYTATPTFTMTFTPNASFTATATSAACTLTNNTSSSGVTTTGCALLVRDTSGCQSSRGSDGLSEAWLKFTCRVAMAVTTISGSSYVRLESDDQPDYPSNYFATTSACYVAYTTSFPDPNLIVAQSVTMYIPMSPNTTNESMSLTMGAVGMAIDGVDILDNQAAPGDDIYQEVGSFDECQGHPNSTGYHYHSEPYSISYNDSNLIGVMRDGYFVYGRKDYDGSTPTLDANGGHVGITADSNGVPVYHYHVNKQTSTDTTTGTAGMSVWFLSTGTYEGTPGSCTGC